MPRKIVSTKSVEPEKLLTSDEASNLKIAQLENELEQTRRELVEALNSAKNGKNTSEESQAGMDALARARNDLQNLLEGTRLATIFLDTHNRIRSFTPSISEIYPLREQDIGRPLSEISHEALEMPPLPGGEFPENWIESKQREFQTDEGRWFLRRVLPCRQDDQLTGVILTFSEISEQNARNCTLAFAHSVTQLLAVAESFEEVIPEILEAMRSNLDADICAMWLIDSDSGALFCDELRNAPIRLALIHLFIPLLSCCCHEEMDWQDVFGRPRKPCGLMTSATRRYFIAAHRRGSVALSRDWPSRFSQGNDFMGRLKSLQTVPYVTSNPSAICSVRWVMR